MDINEAEKILPPKMIDELKDLFKEYKPSEAQRERIVKKVVEIYNKSRFEYGEAVGVVSAQSISEPSTQLTMRSYHVAGAAEVKVTLGLPRLVEIFDARRSPKTPMMVIYLQSRYNTAERARELANEIKMVLLKDIATSSAVDLLKMQIDVALDAKMMREKGVKASKVAGVLKEELKGVSVRESGDGVVIKPKEDISVKEMQKLRAKAMDVHVSGIEDIEQIIVMQKDGEWVLNTVGANLAKILEVEGVDATRTTTNNIHEVAKVLGVEAARNAIVKESSRIIGEQGLDVDVRHLMLVADVMTADGKVKAIGRYGVAGAKGSVLARANFEETIKHLTKAAITAERDMLDSIVENVMINQVVPVGTGMFKLVFKPKK